MTNGAVKSASRLTMKQENFCLEYMKSGNASRAYRLAYNASKMKPETINNKASDLLKKGEIRVRLDELKKPVIDEAQTTLRDHLVRLEDLSKKAADANQFSAAITAEVSRGKAMGFYTENVNINANIQVENKGLDDIFEDE